MAIHGSRLSFYIPNCCTTSNTFSSFTLNSMSGYFAEETTHETRCVILKAYLTRNTSNQTLCVGLAGSGRKGMITFRCVPQQAILFFY